MKRLAMVLLAFVLAGCEDPLGLKDGDWTFSKGTDQISGRPYSQASLNSDFNPGRMELIVRCKEGAFDVYIDAGFITDSPSIRYRIDDQSQRSQTWTNSTNFHALFYPGNAVAFARELAAASKLIFEAREFGKGTVQVNTFQLDGLDARLPEIESMCIK